MHDYSSHPTLSKVGDATRNRHLRNVKYDGAKQENAVSSQEKRLTGDNSTGGRGERPLEEPHGPGGKGLRVSEVPKIDAA